MSLAKSCISIQNVTLGVRRVLTDYNWGIHKDSQWIEGSYRTASDAQPAKLSDSGLKDSLRIQPTAHSTQCYLSYIPLDIDLDIYIE